MTTQQIGAPNSVARYLANGSFGGNKFIVLERINGDLVLVAAQTTQAGAEKYMLPGRELVDVDNCRIIHEAIQGTRKLKSFCLDLDGSLKAQLFTVEETNPIMADQFGPETWSVWDDSSPESVRRFLCEEDARRAYRGSMMHGTNGMA